MASVRVGASIALPPLPEFDDEYAISRRTTDDRRAGDRVESLGFDRPHAIVRTRSRRERRAHGAQVGIHESDGQREDTDGATDAGRSRAGWQPSGGGA